MTLESIHEDILAAIDNKNPSVKAESISFLTRCFTKCTPAILNKKLLKIFITALIKTLNESGKLLFNSINNIMNLKFEMIHVYFFLN